jgi:cell division inhibitor SepF
VSRGGAWNRTMIYLGLKEEPDEVEGDDVPEAFVPEHDPHAEHAPARPNGAPDRAASPRRDEADDPDRTTRLERDRGGERAARERSPSGSRREPERDTSGRASARDADRGTESQDATVRPLRTGDVHVRAVPNVPVARAAVVELSGFDDVESVGARFRTGQAVLFDLSEAPTADARRVVDFVSGLTYATRGQLTKVGSRAFLLVPDGVHLPADERRRLRDLGYRLPTGSDA